MEVELKRSTIVYMVAAVLLITVVPARYLLLPALCFYAGYKMGRRNANNNAKSSVHSASTAANEENAHQLNESLKHAYQSSAETDPALVRLCKTLQRQKCSSSTSMSLEVGQQHVLKTLTVLSRAVRARRAIDLGGCCSCSCLYLALGMSQHDQQQQPWEGREERVECKVIACGWRKAHISEELRSCFKEAGVDMDELITFHPGPTVQTLQQLLCDGESGDYDLIFMSLAVLGDDSLQQYRMGMELLRVGGLLVMLSASKVLHSRSSSKQSCATTSVPLGSARQFIEALKGGSELKQVNYVTLDGLCIVQKL